MFGAAKMEKILIRDVSSRGRRDVRVVRRVARLGRGERTVPAAPLSPRA